MTGENGNSNGNGIDQKSISLACLGGGQLGRMMALEANRMSIGVVDRDDPRIVMTFLDSAGRACPAAQVVPDAQILKGSVQDSASIQNLVDRSKADILTVELEHVHVEALEDLQTARPDLIIRPSPSTLRIIRDKLVQKEHFKAHGIDLPPFCGTPSVAAIKEAAARLGTPLMLKLRRGGYDGRGNAVLKGDSDEDVAVAMDELGITDYANATDLDLYAEGWIDFVGEIAVMVMRSANTYETKSYPAVDAIQQDSICRVVLAPSRLAADPVRESRCEEVARRAVDSLGEGAVGAFGVELFLTKCGKVLLNEVAPRPHNTGHYTQNACYVNQFENHVRAVCGLPLGSTEMMVPAAGMVNILGSRSKENVTQITLRSISAALKMPSAGIHWYGKAECLSGRKMGHINVTGASAAEVDAQLRELLQLEGVPLESVPFGGVDTAAKPQVGIIMGSQSDLPTMDAAVQVLKEFGVPYEVDIVSAHRTPEKLMRYARSAATRGLKSIIAGAGGAAHLPGMVAAMTPLPVIGVPVKTSTLSGVDSLYSIVQMPRGVPVATVAIGNATNAGLLAVRMLGSHDPTLLAKMEAYQKNMKDAVDDTSEKLTEMGSDVFLAQMGDKNTSVNV